MTTDANTTRPARLALLGAPALLGALALATAAGCRAGRDSGAATGAPGGRDPARVTSHGERFPADGEIRPVHRFVRVQSAAAARSGAMLHPHHFDDAGDFNSLGRRKLDLMLQDDAGPRLVLYLDLARPGADAVPADPCRNSVLAYLADRGLDESQVEFRTGPNPGDSHPARDGLRGLREFNDQPPGDAYPTGGAAPSRGSGGIEMFTRPGQ